MREPAQPRENILRLDSNGPEQSMQQNALFFLFALFFFFSFKGPLGGRLEDSCTELPTCPCKCPVQIRTRPPVDVKYD